MIFKELKVAKNCLRPESVPLRFSIFNVEFLVFNVIFENEYY